MATETVNTGLGEVRASSTASGGTALTTTAATVGFPIGTKLVTLIPRNLSTAVVVRYAFNPWLVVLHTNDSGVTYTDYSQNAQDADAGTDVNLSSLATLANGGALYVGSHLPFRGLSVDIDSANGTASDLTGTYWNGSAWTTLSVTDGTANGGATFAVDGAITWTVPSAILWRRAAFRDTALIGAKPTPSVVRDAATTQSVDEALLTTPLYWTRFVVSAALDSSTTCNSIHALNRSTAYAEIPGTVGVEEKITRGFGGVGCVEAATDAGVGNLIVNCATLTGGSFGG